VSSEGGQEVEEEGALGRHGCVGSLRVHGSWSRRWKMEVRVDVMQVEGETKVRMPSRSESMLTIRMVPTCGPSDCGVEEFSGRGVKVWGLPCCRMADLEV